MPININCCFSGTPDDCKMDFNSSGESSSIISSSGLTPRILVIPLEILPIIETKDYR